MRQSSDAGFSLLEVLVAFAVASLALTALVQVYASSAAGARRGADMLAALEIAENRLAEMDALGTIAPGTVGPVAERGFLWQVDVAAEAEQPGHEAPLRLLLVTVTVRAQDDARPVVTLATAKHAQRNAGREAR